MAGDPLIGRTIGSYRVLSKLGEGGMGAVYRAVHGKLDRQVALKILPQRLVDGNPQFVERFFVEARAAARVMHPNIVQVFDAEEVDGLYYIAMEFVKGIDVKGLLARKNPLSELEAVDLTLQAATGLGAAMKQGIIHRDIKPANLMVTPEGVLKIADFGLAKNVQAATELTQSGQIMGTPAYMSPEQADGQKVDFRADMYSLGVCLFETATGRKPYVADTPIGLIKKHCLDPVPDPLDCRPDLDPGFRTLVFRMMAKSRDDRFGSYDELIADLTRLRLALENRASGAVKADASSEIIAIVESSKDTSSESTPTPETKKPSGLRKAMKEGVTLKPLHIALIAGAVLGLGAVLVAILALSGALSNRGGTGDGARGAGQGAPREGEPPGEPSQAETSALESLASARGLKDKGDLDAAIAALDAILGDHPSSKAAVEARRLRETWQEEKREAAAQEEKIARILRQAEALEKDERFDDALAVLSQVAALDPNHAETAALKARIQDALKRKRTDAEREETYRRYMNEADASRIAAKRADRPQDWVLVLEAAEKAKANKDTKEVRDLIATANGRRDLALAKEAEARGDVEEAIRLATLANTYGAEIIGTGAYLVILKSKKADAEKTAERKRQCDFYAGRAREEERRPGADPGIALDFWKKARGFADSEEDRGTADGRITALEAEVARTDAKRRRDDAVASGRKALAAGDLDGAEGHFNAALLIVPDDAEARRGLDDVRTARVEARYEKAMRDGAAAEARKDMNAAKQAYEIALQAKPGDRAAQDAVKRAAAATASTLPGFVTPDSDRDPFGNPVVTRNGSRTDPEGRPYELWLDVPRAPRPVPLIPFVLIPAGSFMMGSPDSEPGRSSDEGPVHRVSLAKPFYMAKYEVTQAQWEAVMGSNPSYFKAAGKDAPVEQVSGDDCREFVKKMNDAVGATGRSPLQFRLPTEAEWEYACRAGTSTAVYTGPLTIRGANNGPELDPIAWYGGNSGVTYEGGFDSSGWPERQYNHSKAGTHPVGKKKPNAWGMYDMIGNVWEWCEDVWHGNYTGAPADGSAWVQGENGSDRVLRGGSWINRARVCRSAGRIGTVPSDRGDYGGFRLVLSPRIQ